MIHPDALTERLRGYADVWRNTVGLSNQQLADLVRSDQIDILIDLAMHTANNRLLMFARKPAPVQVSWLAYPGTTGLSAIDYRLTDPHLDPPGLFDAYYAEESFRLPETYWCYDPLTDQTTVNDLPALTNGVITFGCLNYISKVSDDCLALWARVLRAVPRSRMVLHAPKGQARERVLAKLHQNGIAASRVEFADRQPRLDYFKLYHRIDLTLDTQPWNGGTTTLDAFWMGVPTLTLLGATVAGRAGWSQVCNLGLRELAADTAERYVTLAVGLAGDLSTLQELRSTLRQRLLQSPLMDGKRFARHVEHAYRQMWRKWCQQPPPAGADSPKSPDQPISRRGNEPASTSLRQSLDAAWRHYQMGQWDQAEQLYLQVLEVDPNQVDALHLLAAIAGQTGRESEAIKYLRAVLRLQPGLAAAHNNLGNAFAAQGKFPEAVACFQEAVRLQPGLAGAHNNLGNALREQGRLAEAVASLRQALRLKPDYAEAHQNLGLTLQSDGKLAEAQACLQQAVYLNPDHAEAHFQLGVALGKQEKHAEAAASFGQVLRLQPDHVEAHIQLGVGLSNQGKFDEAAASYEKAIRLKPECADAHHNLGHIRKEQGRIEEACKSIRTAVQLKPEDACFHSNLLLILNLDPHADAKEIYEESLQWHQRHALPLQKLIQPHTNDLDPERRLRIGYISPDFREHPSSSFTIPLLANHDRRACEIFCYANVTRPDGMTERLRGYADVWRNTVGLTDQQLADLVRSDQIDILVDLAMHTANNRLLTFARKPAPVQVTWLAYPGTTGLPAIDYRLTDPHLDPPGLFEAYCVEESVRLPETFWCYGPLTDQPTVNALPASATGVITFGCLNTFCKVNDGSLALWARVLQAVPRSRLLLHTPKGQARERVLAKFLQEGIAAAHVEFADRVPRREYLKLYHRIDLALDPLPCNGGTTTLDAFWMGVPTLTLLGQTVVGRAGWSLLCNLGLQELATETPEQFVALAGRLAGNLPDLQALRSTLRQRMLRSPLMDGKRFAGHVEQAYRKMWRMWCDRAKPAEVGKAIAPVQPILAQGKSLPIMAIPQALALAFQHHQKGNLPQAEQLYGQILQADPGHVDALHLLGVIAHHNGRLEAAMDHFTRALTIKPDFAEAYSNMGIALRDQGKLAEALGCYRRALELKPDFAEAYNNMGIALRDQGKLEEAIACCRRALDLRPDFADAHNNLGVALRDQGKLDEALACLRRAAELKPDFAGVHNNLGNVLKDHGEMDSALACYRRALELQTDFAGAHSNLVYSRLFSLACDAQTLYEEHRRWNQRHAAPLFKFIQPHHNDRSADRRLRVGYVSPDFRSHPVGRFLLPLLEAHDHERFQIFCYSDVHVPDIITERCRSHADVWRNVRGLSDEQVADAIRQDRIDILVDLTMHMADNRLLVFARKPAPVQLTYLAYCGTTGLDTMDYRLTDPYLDPPEQSGQFYTEHSIHLPQTYWCYQSMGQAPGPNELPAFQAGNVTFGCLNNFCKVTVPTLTAWRELLQEVPRSRLLLHAQLGSHRDRVASFFAQRNISPDRVMFVKKAPRAEYLSTYERIDLALDPFPYGGGTTTCDALWMGVPVVSLAGQSALGRGGVSILSNVGLPELVAGDPQRYVRCAAALAQDLSRLGELRATLRDRMQASALMDAPRFARNVEAAYREMWKRWCVK